MDSMAFENSISTSMMDKGDLYGEKVEQGTPSYKDSRNLKLPTTLT